MSYATVKCPRHFNPYDGCKSFGCTICAEIVKAYEDGWVNVEKKDKPNVKDIVAYFYNRK